MVRPCGEKDRRKCSYEKMEVSGHQKIGRQKRWWSDVIRKYMKEKGIQREEAQDRRIWKMKSLCSDPN